MIIYEVRFILYHYNSGAADNGDFKHKMSFTTQEEAEKFGRLVKRLATKKRCSQGYMVAPTGSCKFAEDYCWGGFVERYDGIYEVEINEKKIA